MQALIGNYAVPILDEKQVWGTTDETKTAYLDSMVRLLNCSLTMPHQCFTSDPHSALIGGHFLQRLIIKFIGHHMIGCSASVALSHAVLASLTVQICRGAS